MAKLKNKNVVNLWDILSKAYDTVRKEHSRHIAGHKLTVPQFGVLDVLHSKGSMPLKSISQEMLVTGANITCVVDNLEKENLVMRVHSKKDRRIINAELTAKGKKKIEKILPAYSKNLSGIIGSLTEKEQKDLIRLLNKLVG